MAEPWFAERASLGRSGVTVTKLGLGTSPLGGMSAPVEEDEARATLEVAWDAGLRFFDTAPHYGAGQSERRLGAFLGDRPRADVAVCTKVGRLLVPGDAPPGDWGSTAIRVWSG